ncbi:putative Ig domain-containing protein [Glycomyces arizonensis]|uniref:putative Ig domain-containing protein n=1 Tax=Glycomyces arizonensis TaxID=256035 RepID=UPI000402BC8E|nr:putative Ig domain-containing protein [Glycomyces arizonensis]
MKQAEERRPLRLTSLIAALAVTTGSLAAAAAPAQAEETAADLLTDHVVAIHETVSDAGFAHPGIGLSADDLRNAQAQARAGVEPWASYFAAMTATDFASTTYRASNALSAEEPDRPLDDSFDHGGLRSRETNDSFGALTQSLMWVMTGDEVYRRNAIQALRAWSGMDPDAYAYFPDAHIHTGKPLSQFLMAAEIIRATDPIDDDTPGEYGGYDVAWSAEDDERLLDNLAHPIVETFLYSNEKWMNQHNFGLYGRIATAIYDDDPDAYATGVEWLTVNASYDGYDNGAMAPQMPYIEADDPDNPYGYGFVQVREMARDQAHAETNIDNFTALARMLDVQGTKVDPVAGTVSTADDAVSAYDFLDHRLLDGANAFYGFMMGAWTPWVEKRGEGWDGTVSQAYRGRLFNPLSELYYQYTYESGVDVEAEAPWLAELHSRMDGPYYHYGSGTANFWAPGDKSPEYWVAFPEELAGTEPTSIEDTELSMGRYSLQLDDRTELVTEDGRTFARAHVDEEGTTSVISRMMFSDSAIGLLVRTDGPALLEVLDKEAPSELNPDETEPETLASVELPDTEGQWRYVTYPSGGFNTHFYRLTGAGGTTVDLDTVTLEADAELTAPRFEQDEDRYYLWARDEATIDLSATDDGGSVAYAADLPEGASLDAETGILTWEPSKRDRGRHDVQVVADDGETVAVRTFELAVAKDQKKLIRAALADGYDDDAVYTTVSRERFEAALDEAEDAARHGSDEDFRAAFAALLDAMDGLELLNPTLEDGTLDYTGMVTSTVIGDGAVAALADGDTGSHAGDLRAASFTLDFGTQYRVAADEFGLQARFSFPMRSQGTNVYGSNDGISWTLLTERESSETNDMETIGVVAEHRGEAFRYFKLQVDDPGIPIDPAYPGIWSVGEFRISGERSEVAGTVTDVSLSSDDALRERVTAGDSVALAFSSATPIDDVAVTIGGEAVEATSEDGLSWTAATELGEVTGGGLVPITIDHTTDDGVRAATVLGTTDGSQLYASDERNLVDLAAAAQVVDANGDPDPAKAAQAAAMLDGDTGTHSDIGAVDGEYDVIWDFGEGGTVALDRADFLARQDDNGLTRMKDQVIEGSNDLSEWTALTGPTAAELDWQNLDSLDDGTGYRYLRVANGNIIGIAELRLFGTVGIDLDAVLARADAEDLSAHSRASAILFGREVEAVRAAGEEPDADRNALALRLLDAWSLLEDPPVAAAAIDRWWVTASSPSWDGERDAAANGWAMFDGDSATFTDTEQSTGWVRVVPTEEAALRVETVEFMPRSGYASRADGVQFQGSDDGGQTWETFATAAAPAEGWNTIALAEAVEYGAVRVYAPSGNANLAEVRFTSRIVDTTGLDLYLTETEALTEGDWTAETWAALAEARDAGLALRAEGAEPTQEEVDAAADTLAGAIAALSPAALVPTQ